ncbi:MAG: hypothetical protein P8169_10365, partial [Chloroflexota bacterium]
KAATSGISAITILSILSDLPLFLSTGLLSCHVAPLLFKQQMEIAANLNRQQCIKSSSYSCAEIIGRLKPCLSAGKRLFR